MSTRHPWTAEWARFCPRCGEEALGSANGRRHACNACGFVYFHNPAAAVCALLRHERDLALVVRGKDPARGKLDLPGGFVDPAEDLEQALVRELQEELALEISTPQYRFSVPNTYRYRNVDYWTMDMMFEIWLPARVMPTPDGVEVTALHWASIVDIDEEMLAFHSVRIAVARLKTEYKC